MITDEGERLARIWDGYGSEELDRYLVQEIEHPGYNPQSVLIRAFVIDRLFPSEFDALVEEELYFAACASFAVLGRREGWFPTLYRRLRWGDAEDDLPGFLRSDYRKRFGSRFDVVDLFSEIAISFAVGFDDFRSPFDDFWRERLRERAAARFSALELGCGSANDYRFLNSYGVGCYLNYVGVDVSSKNVENARRRHPDATFLQADVCALDFSDQSFDVTFAFDLYEHLSPTGLEMALDETLRVTSEEVWLSLFTAAVIPDHEFRPKGDYHWNLLSLPTLATSMEAAGFETQVISVASELEGRFEEYRHYNKEAYIVIGQRSAK